MCNIGLKSYALLQASRNASDYTRCSVRASAEAVDHPPTPFNPGPSGGGPQNSRAHIPIHASNINRVYFWNFPIFFVGVFGFLESWKSNFLWFWCWKCRAETYWALKNLDFRGLIGRRMG